MPEQLSVRIGDDLAEMIEEEREASPYNPDKSDIVRTALREYLSGNATKVPLARAD